MRIWLPCPVKAVSLLDAVEISRTCRTAVCILGIFGWSTSLGCRTRESPTGHSASEKTTEAQRGPNNAAGTMRSQSGTHSELPVGDAKPPLGKATKPPLEQRGGLFRMKQGVDIPVEVMLSEHVDAFGLDPEHHSFCCLEPQHGSGIVRYHLYYDRALVQRGLAVRFENGFFRSLTGLLRLTPGAPTEPKLTASQALDRLIQALDHPARPFDWEIDPKIREELAEGAILRIYRKKRRGADDFGLAWSFSINPSAPGFRSGRVDALTGEILYVEPIQRGH